MDTIKTQYQDEDDKDNHYEDFIANLLRINYLNSIQGSGVYDISKFTDHIAEDNKFLIGYLKNDEKYQASKTS
ncbi:unnamed protein product [Parnassius apollo]|uniref:(apollo) hypothetical protein n=1 Tax=Parnassius apollo TaxID=110799 RepID=A0A8S3WQC4_PARAO|nr:unnamed protein product [Parnassius apollo]